MKPLLFKIILICIILPNIFVSGQEDIVKNKASLRIVASYSPSYIYYYTEWKDRFFPLGGNLGIQYCNNRYMNYTLDVGFWHSRIINKLLAESPAYSYEYFNYIYVTAGIEILPFGPEHKIDPFVGASISPLYLRTTSFILADIPYNLGTSNSLLLNTNIEFGFYFFLSDKINMETSIFRGFNLLPDRDIMLNLHNNFGAKLGISYQL